MLDTVVGTGKPWLQSAYSLTAKSLLPVSLIKLSKAGGLEIRVPGCLSVCPCFADGCGCQLSHLPQAFPSTTWCELQSQMSPRYHILEGLPVKLTLTLGLSSVGGKYPSISWPSSLPQFTGCDLVVPHPAAQVRCWPFLEGGQTGHHYPNSGLYWAGERTSLYFSRYQMDTWWEWSHCLRLQKSWLVRAPGKRCLVLASLL